MPLFVGNEVNILTSGSVTACVEVVLERHGSEGCLADMDSATTADATQPIGELESVREGGT